MTDAPGAKTHAQLDRLLGIMAHLRDPRCGCEWDIQQTFATIAPYTIEEAYEVADAIERDDFAALRDELGDLLLQVVFHARIAEEASLFGFADVAGAISQKLENRHPHIFGQDAPEKTQRERWETIKAQERAAKGATSALDGVATALPALMRAEKLQKRAARAGFDWPDETGPRAKVLEELDELAQATNDAERLMEAGDLLFSVVNLLRFNDIAPEDALRAANRKFEQRFKAMEAAAVEDGVEFASLEPSDQERYWQLAKSSERGETS